jgi:thiamine biosynthesis lipoprotein ApbE
VSTFLDNKVVANYIVELGGRLKAKGKKENENWKVGIDKPDEKENSERKLEAIINLNDKARATSGKPTFFFHQYLDCNTGNGKCQKYNCDDDGFYILDVLSKLNMLIFYFLSNLAFF